MTIDNQLRDIQMTSSDVENQAKNMKLDTHDKTKDPYIESENSFPLFITSFHAYLSIFKKLPSQAELWLFYRVRNHEVLKTYNLSPTQLKALRARVYRTYCSLVRELHAALLIRESSIFETTCYNQDVDTKYGFDVLGTKDDKVYGIKLMVKTKRSMDFCDRKDNVRHKNTFEDVIPIRLPLDLSLGTNCGDLIFYNDNQLKELREAINKQDG